MALLRALRSLSLGTQRTAAEALAPSASAAARTLRPGGVIGLLDQVRHMSGGKLFIGGLPWEADDGTLKDAFASYGEIVEARVVTDRVTGRSRGFGFVSYSSEEAAQNALAEMDGKFLGGRAIRVEYSSTRDTGMARGGGGRRFDDGYGDSGSFGRPGGGRRFEDRYGDSGSFGRPGGRRSDDGYGDSGSYGRSGGRRFDDGDSGNRMGKF